MENISIPEDVSLLGVDNDELICNISDPPISSIELEVEKGGYAVGKLLHRQIRKEFVGPFNVVINPIRIELRQSTEKHNIEDPYVLRIVKYIERHIAADLTIDAIIGQIPLSRRNIELKFKRVMNTSIYQYVLKCRVKRFANLLLTTDLPLAEIAGEAGFRDCNNIFADFQEVYGLLADRIPSAAFGRQIVRFSKHAFRFSTTDPWRCPVSLYYGVRSSGGSLCAT